MENHNLRYNPKEILREISEYECTDHFFGGGNKKNTDWIEKKPDFWKNLRTERASKEKFKCYHEHSQISSVKFIRESEKSVSLITIHDYISYVSRGYSKTDRIKRQQGSLYKGYKTTEAHTISISDKGVVRITTKRGGTKTLSFRCLHLFQYPVGILTKLLCLKPNTEWLEKQLNQGFPQNVNIPNSVIYSVSSKEEFLDLLDVSDSKSAKFSFQDAGLHESLLNIEQLVYFTNPQDYLKLDKSANYLTRQIWSDILNIAKYVKNVKFEYTIDYVKSCQILNDLLYLCAVKGIYTDFSNFCNKLNLRRYHNSLIGNQIPF